MKPWLFRVDADSTTGMGHLRRSLSLAHALRDVRVPVRFLTSAHPTSLGLIRQAGFEAEGLSGVPSWSARDLGETLELARGADAVGVLVDSEEAGSEYFSGLRQAGFLTAVRDDLGLRALRVDLVINGNAGAERLPYAGRDAATRYLLGPSFAVLAPDFWEPPERAATSRKKLRLLLMAGGADSAGFLPDLARRLGNLGGLHLSVVAGPFFRNAEGLRGVCRSLPRPAQFFRDPVSLSSVMGRSHLAVTAAGQTLYDLACAGCPAIAYEGAPNQAGQLRAMEEQGCLIRIESGGGEFPGMEEQVLQLVADPASRDEMAGCGQRLVDGKGAGRVALEMAALCGAEKLVCHPKP